MRRLLLLLMGIAVLMLIIAAGLFLRQFPYSTSYWIAVAQLEAGMESAAAKRATRLVESKDELRWEYYRLLATAQRRMGNHSEQLDSFRAGIHAFPNDDRAHHNLCWYGSLFGTDLQELEDACNQGVELSPNDEGLAFARRAAWRMLVDDQAGAIEDLEVAMARWDARGYEGAFIDTRRHWLEELKKGQNPLGPEELEVERGRF